MRHSLNKLIAALIFFLVVPIYAQEPDDDYVKLKKRGAVVGLAHSFGRAFSGTSQGLFSSASVTLGSTKTMSVWLWRAVQNGSVNDSICAESSANVNSNAGAFFVDCRSTAATGGAGLAFGFNNGSNTWQCYPTAGTNSPPHDGTWHSVLFVINVGVNPNTCSEYIDGASKATSFSGTNTITTQAFANFTINIACRNASGTPSLCMNGSESDFAIWSADESSNASALNGGTLPSAVDSGNLISYVPMCGTASPEPDKATGSWTWTLTGSPTQTSGPGANKNCP